MDPAADRLQMVRQPGREANGDARPGKEGRRRLGLLSELWPARTASVQLRSHGKAERRKQGSAGGRMCGRPTVADQWLGPELRRWPASGRQQIWKGDGREGQKLSGGWSWKWMAKVVGAPAVLTGLESAAWAVVAAGEEDLAPAETTGGAWVESPDSSEGRRAVRDAGVRRICVEAGRIWKQRGAIERRGQRLVAGSGRRSAEEREVVGPGGGRAEDVTGEDGFRWLREREEERRTGIWARGRRCRRMDRAGEEEGGSGDGGGGRRDAGGLRRSPEERWLPSCEGDEGERGAIEEGRKGEAHGRAL